MFLTRSWSTAKRSQWGELTACSCASKRILSLASLTSTSAAQLYGIEFILSRVVSPDSWLNGGDPSDARRCAFRGRVLKRSIATSSSISRRRIRERSTGRSGSRVTSSSVSPEAGTPRWAMEIKVELLVGTKVRDLDGRKVGRIEGIRVERREEALLVGA